MRSLHPEGLLLVDKPRGPTSHDVVARIRRLSGQRKTGHTGTLDPMATGLLPMVLGRATRLARFLPHSPKSYEGTFRLGLVTATDDITGDTVSRYKGDLPSRESVREAASRFVGRILQTPPAVSARKVDGQRSYKLARRGQTVSAPASEIEIEMFEVEPVSDDGLWSFSARVSTGTYLRALARDMGEALGCGGALASLRRTAVGSLSIDQAIPLQVLEERGRTMLDDILVPLSRMPLGLPALELHLPLEVQRFVAGAPVFRTGEDGEVGTFSVVGPAGELLGVAEADSRKIQPRLVLVDMQKGG